MQHLPRVTTQAMSNKTSKKPGGEQLRCPSCGAPSDASDRFCRKCGTVLSGDEKANGGMRRLTGLRAFGLIIVALAIFYAVLVYTRGGSQSQQPPAQPISIGEVGAGSRGAAQPVTRRGAADQLFNQAMTAHETGDSAAATQLVPMALAAYRGLETLDPDARYHMALLSLAANRPEDALAQADTMLAEVPDHLLALSVSARAYLALGQEDMAADYFRRFLGAYTPEVAASRPEYLDHSRALPARRETARRYLQERGLLPEGS